MTSWPGWSLSGPIRVCTLLDGRERYGTADVDAHPLPDALHPNRATRRLVGEHFARSAFGEGGAFEPAPPASDGGRSAGRGS